MNDRNALGPVDVYTQRESQRERERLKKTEEKEQKSQ